MAVCLIASISKIQFKFKLHSRCAATAAATAASAKVQAAEITECQKGRQWEGGQVQQPLKLRQPLKLWQKSLKQPEAKTLPILI